MFTYATKSEKEETNSVSLSGEIVTEPTFSHEVFGESFFDVKLKVPRLSQTFDLLPLTVSERLTCNFPLFVGQQISLRGQLRSFNKQVDNKSRLLLSVFVRELLPYDSALSPNDVQLDGFLCKQPVFRTTPFNREICDLLLAVNRAYGKSDYIPAIAWGRNARFVKFLPVGQEVKIIGRLQSREYQKKISEVETETKTAYEVSIGKIMTTQSSEVINSEVETDIRAASQAD